MTVFVVMGSGDNNGTLPEYTLRVFAERKDAVKYKKELQNQFFCRVTITERQVNFY